MTSAHTPQPARTHPALAARGYPEGVPQHDYVALFGILRRSCTEDEIEKIALELRHEGFLSNAQPEDEIRERLRRYLHETPHEEDVRRVAARLAAGGWLHAHPGARAAAGVTRHAQPGGRHSPDRRADDTRAVRRTTPGPARLVGT